MNNSRLLIGFKVVTKLVKNNIYPIRVHLWLVFRVFAVLHEVCSNSSSMSKISLQKFPKRLICRHVCWITSPFEAWKIFK